jgi:hypothetical protein
MKLKCLFALACGVILSSTAGATSILTVDFDPQGRYLNPLSFSAVNGPKTGYAGVISATLDGQHLDLFCVDLYHDVSPGVNYTVNIWAPNDPAAQAYSLNLGRAAWLYLNYLPVVNAAVDKDVEGAALQLAIWDVIHDSGDGLATGTIKLDAGTTNAASQNSYGYTAQWITASSGHSINNAAVLINVGGPNASQTLLAAVPNAVPTPEAATFGTMGTALLVLGLVGRKRLQRAAETQG